MTQPICDFAREYAAGNSVRLHMPGHKGQPLLGPEELDLTEIPGADVLYHAQGIIRESEANAAALFGSAKTLYSAEGSSLCIRAMLYLARLHALRCGKKPKVLAGRNAHKVFLSAAALLDLEVGWIYPEEDESLLSCRFSPEKLEHMLERESYTAFYLTSPDYLGNMADLAACAEVCRRKQVLFLVDNAHGAYLKFLLPSAHPMDLGADLCCDSAHKTLPVLTGGACLHFSRTCPAALLEAGEQAMSLFAGTSPSYLILQSLDRANSVLAREFPQQLSEAVKRLGELKEQLFADGWMQAGDEPMKLTLMPKKRGMTGCELAEALEKRNIICEFADPDYVVMMFSACSREKDYDRLHRALKFLPEKPPLPSKPPRPVRAEQIMTPREAMLAPFETLPVSACRGRILASPSVSCPPAVPVLVCGERITDEAIALFEYYGIEKCDVVY